MKFRPYWFLIFGLATLQPLHAQTETPKDGAEPKLDIGILPKVTEWLKDTESHLYARSQEALAQGPAALEELANHLQTEERKDKDGRYTTPYFFKTIVESDKLIGAESQRDYQKRVFREWREKFPASQAAILAQAELEIGLAWDARGEGGGNTVVGDRWRLFSEHQRNAVGLLEECKTLQKKDPRWYILTCLLMKGMEAPWEDFQQLSEQMFVDFPDSEYVLSRGIEYMSPKWFGRYAVWEFWLRDGLKNCSADLAAKYYTRTMFEVVALNGFENTGQFDILSYTEVDKGKLARGLDLLALEFPESPRIATSEAAISAFMLKDPKRAFAALRRANGRIDLHILKTPENYEKVIQFISTPAPKAPKGLKDIGLPAIVSRRSMMPVEISARIEEASLKGPAALEELVKKFQTDEMLDADGFYMSRYFFEWFAYDEMSTGVAAYRGKLERLLGDWKKAFPDSMNLRLAQAKYCLSTARAAHQFTDELVTSDRLKIYRDQLKQVRKNLEACTELQMIDPVWSEIMFSLCVTEKTNRDEFEEISKDFFEQFPECESSSRSAILYLSPTGSGKKGEWEPWLRDKIKELPADVQARAYARAIISLIGYWHLDYERWNDMIKAVKIDQKLLQDGVRLLHEKYPHSTWVDNGEAAIAAYLVDDVGITYEMVQKMGGHLDMRVWQTDAAFQKTTNWMVKEKTK